MGMALASVAMAQAAAPATKPDDTVSMGKVSVTGSYLPISATVTASPVVTIESSDIGASGASDTLQLLKQLTPYFQGNGNVGIEMNNETYPSGGGEAAVALRNLTTLVLINGQRLVASPRSNGEAVDVGTIPTAMIDRIEILKDGASTIYGSDAIGGVVNVILKKDYTGFETGVREGTTSKNDYKTRSVYIMGGVSQPGFSLMVGAQHSENTPLLTTDRPLTLLNAKQINALGYNVISAVFSGSYPGRVNSDILAGEPLAVGAPGYNAAIVTPPAKASPSAAPQTLAQLETAGIYIPVSSTPAFTAVGSTSILNTALFGNPLIVPTKRNQFIADGDKELIGKNLEVFGDFMYVQASNGGTGLAPAPIAGAGTAGGNSLTIPANNPYNLFGITLGIGAPAGAPTVRTRTIELGKRLEINNTNTYRFVGGFKGDISDDFSWETQYNYSRADWSQQSTGYANGANMNQLMIPLLDGAGNYVYANGRPLSIYQDSTGTNLPVYDYFAAPGFNDPNTLKAMSVTLFRGGVSALRDISFRVKGKPFELPAGPLLVAVGIESRLEELNTSVDGLFANGLALGANAAKTFGGGSRRTTGEFVETSIPLVSSKMGMPVVHTLELSLSDRQEKIKPGGNANTPKVGIRWLPFDDSLVFRATYSKGFIAPAIYALFGPANVNSPTLTTFQGNGSSGSGGTLAQTVTVQVTSNELSNPLLQPSKSKSYTGGFVFSPKAIKGLSFTFDYYDITEDKVGSIDYTAVAADLNAKGSASAYASGFLFADGTKLTTTATNQVNSTNFGVVTLASNPTGDQKLDGVDLAVNYNFRTDSIGSFGVGASANILFNYKFRATPNTRYLQYARNFTDSTTGGAGYEGLLPGYTIKPYVNYSFKGLTASLFMNYIPTVTVPGTLFGTGLTTGNAYTINGLASKTPSYFTADLTVGYKLPDFGKHWLHDTTISVGANNLFNRPAPYIPTDGNAVGENNTDKAAYDIIGRFVFVDLKKSF
jgi:iron complex outermembrane receptor protein